MRDPKAEAILVAMELRPELSREQAQAFLDDISSLISSFAGPGTRGRVASVVPGLGRSFFLLPDSTARFGLEGRMPAGFAELHEVPSVESMPTDVLMYALVTEEASAAEFLKGISAMRASLAEVSVDRGFQRGDGRELFGFPDGLRSAPYPGRYGVVFVDHETTGPEEPDWTEDGTYMTYLKIRQDLDSFLALAPDAQEAVFGRRRSDGSRLDLPEGSDPHTEPEFSDGAPPVNSHVRKAGPRGEERDKVQIFRRGVLYLSLQPDGSLDAGLHFVSFQAALDQFDTIFSSWMVNADFPAQGSGEDELFRGTYATIVRAGFYFVPPFDPRYIGVNIFDPPRPVVRPRDVGRVILRKRALNDDGTRARADLASCVFQIFDQGGQPVGQPFTTDSAGYAMSGDLPVRVPLTLPGRCPPRYNWCPLRRSRSRSTSVVNSSSSTTMSDPRAATAGRAERKEPPDSFGCGSPTRIVKPWDSLGGSASLARPPLAPGLPASS